jgi:hypothetical protein
MIRATVATMMAVLLGACSSEPWSPVGTGPEATPQSDAQIVSTAVNGVQRDTYRIDVPFDWYLTPADYPCLTETIHVFGSYQEYLNFFVNPSSGVHLTLHQTTDNVTAVGVTTGDRYHNSGPLTLTFNGSTDQVEIVEFTFHNINHFVGPGRDSNIYLRTLSHVTFDPATGATKVEVFRDDVLCH